MGTDDIRSNGILNSRWDESIRDKIKAYSGCSNVSDTLVESVKKFGRENTYIIVSIAEVVGKWLRIEGSDAAEKIEAVLKECKGDEKLFIARYIWEAIFRCNTKLAELEAIPLIITARFGPLPRKFFEEPIIDVEISDVGPKPISKHLANEIDFKQRDEWIRNFITQLSTLNRYIVIVLNLIVSGEWWPLDEARSTLEPFIRVIQERKRILLEAAKHMGLEERHFMLQLVESYLAEMLNRELKKNRGKCWKRAVYLIGSTIGDPQEGFDIRFPRIGDDFRDTECSIDDWFLVENEPPPLLEEIVPRLVIRNPDLIISDKSIFKNIKKEIGKIKKRKDKWMILFNHFAAGLVLIYLSSCKGKKKVREGLYLLEEVLTSYIHTKNLSRIGKILLLLGEKLNWPQELAPLLCDALLRGEDPSLILLALRLYERRDGMEPWAKAYLAESFAKLHLRSKFYMLLNEIARDDERMGCLTAAISMYFIIRTILEYNSPVREIDLDFWGITISKLEKAEDFFKSKNVIEYFRWKYHTLELKEAFMHERTIALVKYLTLGAHINLIKGLKEARRDLLEDAAKKIDKAAELTPGFESLIYKSTSARLNVLLMDELDAKVLGKFVEICKEISRSYPVDYLPRLGYPYDDYENILLAECLVALALLKEKPRSICLERQRHYLLQMSHFKYSVIARYMLNVLAGYEGVPSDREAYMALRVREEEVNRSEMLQRLTELGMHGEEVKDLSDEELWELTAPTDLLSRFILLLKALHKGSHKLARLHALCASNQDIIRSRLFEEFAEALKECEDGGLSERAKLALVKLFYYLNILYIIKNKYLL